MGSLGVESELLWSNKIPNSGCRASQENRRAETAFLEVHQQCLMNQMRFQCLFLPQLFPSHHHHHHHHLLLHHLSLIPDNTLTLVARMVFVQEQSSDICTSVYTDNFL